MIRTNVQFAGIGDSLRTLVVTSPGAGEGKTSVATDLAVAYAQAGQRVILVDADLRKPRVGETFKTTDEPGLTGVLLGGVPLSTALRPWKDGLLQVMTSGARPARPSELLASSKMAELLLVLRDEADVVIVDSAPVMPVADTIGLVAHADAVLVVVRVGSTHRSALTATVARLQSVDARVVGIVANGSATEGGDGYYAPKERRGLLRRGEAVKLLDVPVKTVQATHAAVRPGPSASRAASKHDGLRAAGANGSLSSVPPSASGSSQDPPAADQA